MNNPATKFCHGCNTPKPLDAFNRRRKVRDGRQSRCRECEKGRYDAGKTEILQRQADYYQANREAVRERQRQAYQDDPEYFLQRNREWVSANPEKAAASSLLWHAHIAALVFNHYGHVCACCGTEKDLTTDHVNGDGAQHRQELFGDPQTGGSRFYLWLVDNGFPAYPPLQVLCRACNISKAKGAHCRLLHGVVMPLWLPYTDNSAGD